jgi:hypothetical protein
MEAAGYRKLRARSGAASAVAFRPRFPSAKFKEKRFNTGPLPEREDMRHGDPALPIRRPHHDGPRGFPASGLDAGAPVHDAVVLGSRLPAASRRRPGLCRVRKLRPLRLVQRLLASRFHNASHRRRCPADHGRLRRLAGDASGSADVGAGHRPHPRDRAVLRDADRLGAGLEEHVHGPHQRRLRPSVARLRGRSRGLAERCSDPVDHPDRVVAVAALSPR